MIVNNSVSVETNSFTIKNNDEGMCAKFQKICSKTARILSIIGEEGYAKLRHTLPAGLKWVFRKYITREIVLQETLKEVAGKTTQLAYLSLHGKFPEAKDQTITPVLLLHGDMSHPLGMLHLADEVQELSLGPVFSLYIPQTSGDIEPIRALLQKAIDKIENMVKERGAKFEGILGAGPSKGAILLAQRQFVDLDKRIKATFSIAGRLNIPQEDRKTCHPSLFPIIDEIYKGIIDHPQLPLVQIVPINDWKISEAGMAVRPKDHCHFVPGMHASSLNKSETRKHFSEFVREFSAPKV